MGQSQLKGVAIGQDVRAEVSPDTRFLIGAAITFALVTLAIYAVAMSSGPDIAVFAGTAAYP
jgi:hypothetical protein